MRKNCCKFFFSVFAVITVILLSLTFSAGAEDLTFGAFGKGITWEYDDETKCLTVSGKGEIPDCNNGVTAPWKSLEVKKLVIEEGVTRIGDGAFGFMEIEELVFPDSLTSFGRAAFRSNNVKEVVFPEGTKVIPYWIFAECRSLERVVIPEGVELIDEMAFDCSRIEELILPDSLKELGKNALSGCGALKRVTIGSGLEKLSQGAFRDCRSLESIVIPDNVTILSGSVFSGCTNLKTVVLHDKIKEMHSRTFENCQSLTYVEIPESVTVIDAANFKGCTSLKEVVYKGEITEILYDAFCDCKSLEKVTFTGDITAVGNNAFKNCGSLKELNVGKALKTIGNYSFYECVSLETVDLPETLTSIGEQAFRGCTSLKEARLTDNLTALGRSAFVSCSSLTELYFPEGEKIEFSIEGCSSLKNIRIPYGLKRLTLKGCSSLEKVEIPETVTELISYCFMDCSSLKEVIIPDTVTEIYTGGLFENCTSLERVELPYSVSVIAENMFRNCSSLKQVVTHRAIETISSGAFYNCESFENFPVSENTSISGASAVYNTKWYNAQPDGVLYYADSVVGFKGEMPENTRLTFKEGTKNISGSAFENCTGLVAVEIPGSIVNIFTKAFYGCSNLTEIKVPDKAIRIGSKAFHDTGWYKQNTNTWKYIGSVLYEYSVSRKEYRSIKIGSSVKAIAADAFYNVASVGLDMLIESSVEYIGARAIFQPDALWVDVTVKNVNCVFDSGLSIKADYSYMTFINSYTKNSTAYRYCVENKCDYTNLTCSHSYKTKAVIKAATCVEDGEKIIVCKNCAVESTQTIQSKGHSFNYKVINQPSCTEHGLARNTCTVCGEIDSVILTAKGHVNVTKTVAPTCEEQGYTFDKCGVCGNEKKYDFTQAMGHSLEEITVPATDTEQGKRTTFCINCEKEETVYIDKIEEITISSEPYVYSSYRTAPDITIRDSAGNILVYGEDYIVTYSDNRDVGIAQANIRFTGAYGGEEKRTYKILPEVVKGLKAKATASEIKLTWSKTALADGYIIYKYNSKTKKYEEKARTSKLTHTFSKLKSAKEYTYYIKAYKATEDETVLSAEFSSVSATTKPSKVKLSSLKSTKKNQMAVTWKSVSATGYEVQYSTSKKFTEKTTKKVTVKNAKAKKTTLKKLKSGKKYYVKVRAYKTVDGKKLYGAYSEVKTVKVK